MALADALGWQGLEKISKGLNVRNKRGDHSWKDLVDSGVNRVRSASIAPLYVG